MRILLIYPQYTHSNSFDSRAPSMSLVYLASTLDHYGHQVSIYDASLGPIVNMGKVFQYGVSDEEFRDFLLANKFDIAGISCAFTPRWKFTAKIAYQLREIYPSIPIAVGGLFPTSRWEYCLKNCSAVDFVMLGEAELTFAQIVNSIAQGYDIHNACKDVDGVAWRSDGRLFCNQKQIYNNKLDELPFPTWHLLDLKKYFTLQRNIFELPAPCLPILSSRSCPYRCRFCNMYITHGKTWRARSAENVLSEIEYLIKQNGIRRFYFIDDNFGIDLKRAKSICRGIIERKLNIKYNFYNGLSIKTIDSEFIKLLKESGCTSVCLAIESGSEYIRNTVYRKNLGLEKIIEVFNSCHKVGLPTIAYFIVGAPGEKRADIEETKKLIAKLPMTLMTVNVFMPYPGTELYDECQEKGWLLETSIEDENRVEMFSPMVRTPDFRPGDVLDWQKELYFTFIRHHWLTLIKEFFRPMGLVNMDMIGKFLGVLRFYLVNRFFCKELFRNNLQREDFEFEKSKVGVN